MVYALSLSAYKALLIANICVIQKHSIKMLIIENKFNMLVAQHLDFLRALKENSTLEKISRGAVDPYLLSSAQNALGKLVLILEVLIELYGDSNFSEASTKISVEKLDELKEIVEYGSDANPNDSLEQFTEIATEIVDQIKQVKKVDNARPSSRFIELERTTKINNEEFGLIQKKMVGLEGSVRSIESKIVNFTDETNELIKNHLTEEKLAIPKLAAEAEKLLAEITKVKTIAQEALAAANQKGLAGAFAARKNALTKAGYGWAAMFVIGIILIPITALLKADTVLSLTAKVFIATPLIDNSPTSLLVSKIAFSVPLIWFTWFCARQYSKTRRLIENYAFKEASAIAYIGYKTEMHDDPKMMELLRTAAINSFGEDPNKSEKDEPISPFSDFLEKAIDKLPADKVGDVLVGLMSKKKN